MDADLPIPEHEAPWMQMHMQMPLQDLWIQILRQISVTVDMDGNANIRDNFK